MKYKKTIDKLDFFDITKPPLSSIVIVQGRKGLEIYHAREGNLLFDEKGNNTNLRVTISEKLLMEF